MNKPFLTIVVPCYNEEEVFKETSVQLSTILTELIEDSLVSYESKLLFVDDGSKDRTWELIQEESTVNPYVTGLKLAS